MKRIFFLLFAVCVSNCWAVAQSPSRNDTVSPTAPLNDGRSPEPQKELSRDFTIGPGDVLSITVWHEPDLTNKVTVRPDGKISMPLLNDLQASDLTPKELQQQITEALKNFVSGPQVSVIVQEIHSQTVYITGSVARPGAYPLGRPLTVMELLVLAGGLSESAKAEEIQILRREADKLHRFRFNYKQFVEGRNYQQNIFLRPSDMVIVP
jgi:polysaccharide export outer membrane protein